MRYSSLRVDYTTPLENAPGSLEAVIADYTRSGNGFDPLYIPFILEPSVSKCLSCSDPSSGIPFEHPAEEVVARGIG